MERSNRNDDRGLAALERIKNIRTGSGTGKGVNLIKVDQTTQQIVLSSFFTNPLIEQAAREIREERNLTPVQDMTSIIDDGAPPLEEDQDEQRVERRLLREQVEGVGGIQDTNPESYTGLKRDTVVVLQNLLPEDDIMGLAAKRAQEKGLIILL